MNYFVKIAVGIGTLFVFVTAKIDKEFYKRVAEASQGRSLRLSR